ncbi:MAG: sulfatase-like hydrolase/transferase, partial [Oscillospiraceae bacterium]|nr:sulfatase-like hydrolase/transferase [Oscillospiraceae bacterium]
VYIIHVCIWAEIISRVKVFGFSSVFERGMLFTLLFSVSLGSAIAFLSTLFSPKVNRIIAFVLLLVHSICICTYFVYQHVFAVFPSVASVSGAGALAEFFDITLYAIAACWLPLILTLLPVVAVLFFGKLGIDTSRAALRPRICIASSILVFYLFGAVTVYFFDNGSPSPKSVYYDNFISMLSARNFGIVTSIRLEFQHLAKDNPTTPDTDVAVSISDEYLNYNSEEYNIIEIDFDALAETADDPQVAMLHGIFSEATPTEKNEYTGIFAGKNLIFITAESFSPYAIDPDITPTLYKMSNGGFVFTNYYCPLWGVSTTDGEYANCHGLMPKIGAWSFQQTAENALPFALGNQLSAVGYNCKAYHNHDYLYYRRDLTHPNMGYSTFKGVGNGLDISEAWPESDSEMFAATIDEYIDSTPFHTYYMTVSGHMNYNFKYNDMSIKNRAAVENLDISEEAKAYLAANLELEYALTELMAQLEQKGIAEDTVIVIAPDHYPYALSQNAAKELSDEPFDDIFDVYKSTLIIYTPDMEPVVVDELCSSLDILPTVSNLFGLEYDSRMFSGRDIFSDTDPLVIFGNFSWMTDYGYYDTYTGRFAANGSGEPYDGYVEDICAETALRYKTAAAILDSDYYSAISH